MFTIDGARQRIKTALHRERFSAALLSAGRTGTKRSTPYASYTPARFIRNLDFALTRLVDQKDIVAVTVRMLGDTQKQTAATTPRSRRIRITSSYSATMRGTKRPL